MRKTARLQHALFRLFIPTALVLSCLVGAAPAEDEFEDQGDDDWSTTTNVYQFGTEQFHDLDSADDEDWIKVELDEGEVYLFELYNAPEVNLELELYADAQDGGTTYLGRARAQSYMDNGVRNRIAYRAHRTATCFVRVYRSGSAADSYYFRTRLGSASGPLTNGGGETGGLLVAAQPVRLADGAIRGEFASPPNVRAGYRIDLAAGQRLVATAKLTGTASSPDLSLAYPSGYEIARKSMWRSGAAYEATIDFTAPFAGGYLLSLVSSQATASYEISFAGSAVAPTGRLAGQVQVDQGSAAGVRVRTARSGHEAFTDGEGRFALDLPAGTYDLIAEHSSIGATGFRGATVRSGETTEVTIAAEAVPDDDSESYEGANVVAPSDFPLQRAIDYPGDVDWYRFAAEGGKRYVVDLLRPTGSDVKLDYYYFTGALYREADLENGEPTPLGQVSEGYVGRRASVRLNDPGWIYVKLASGYGSPKVGLYELRVREEGAADPIDDDVFLAATPVETDGTLVPGVIATDGDEHYYSFDADQGERYDIAILRSAGVDASFEVVWVAPASTSEVLELDNPTGGEGLVHRQATFVPTPPGKQRYYVKVSPSDYACCPSVGTYELRIFGPGTDQTPPPRVTDLRAKSAAKEVIGAARADAGGGYVVLEWTAPQGAREYDVRYRTSTLSEEYWYDHAVMVRAPAPRPGGTAEQLLVSGLEPGTRYYFGVRSMDERLNVAEISNVVTAVASETAPITAVPAMTPLLAAWLTGWAIGLGCYLSTCPLRSPPSRRRRTATPRNVQP
ncbi:MAG: hypothetical protein HYV63_14710 [Candidatus Schekmanbacteria bacterium]|nr:hypothetical protein [Candidatus Schekmanbacteria bacterium]